VREFREKPGAEVAAQYVAAGDYYWNSGIFVWKSAAVLGELNRLKPGIHDAVQRIAAAWETPTREAVFRAEYARPRRSASTSRSWKRPGGCSWFRHRTTGTTWAAGWRWSGGTRKTRTGTRFKPCTSASTLPIA